MTSKVLLALMLLTSAFSVFAQTRGALLEGTVEDQSGAVIPNVSVTVVNEKTQVSATQTTNSAGAFVFPNLQPGIYTMTVDAAGFRKAIVNGIELTVGATVAQTVKLEIGQTTESVVVQANALNVQTTESQVSSAVTLRELDILPTLGRNPLVLAVFQPGVQVDVRAGSQDATFSHVNGLRQGSNNSTLDGIDVNDAVVPRLGLSLTANNTDSVEEFRVVTQGGKAEYGRNAGAQVQLITRSGTNTYHGSAFDYLRNTDLNANDFFNNQSGSPVPKYIRNIFGASFGGPIIHDKTFIFGNYQGNRTRQEVIRVRTVPTVTAKQGVFRWRDKSGAIQAFNFAQADPRSIGIDPSVAKILAQYPDPNNNDVGDGLNSAGFRFNNPVTSYTDEFTIRGDHHLTNNQVLFLRWSWQRNSSIDSLNGADATFPGQIQGTQGGHRWGYSAGWDWTITPTLVNEFRFGHQSATTDFLRPNRPAGPAYITNLFTDVQFSGFSQGRNSPVNDFSESLTKVIAKHTFKGGFNLRFTTQYGYNYAGVYPNVTTQLLNGNNVPASFGPQGLSATDRTTFEQLYNDVLGRIDQVTQTFYSDLQKFQAAGTPRVRNFLVHESGYYFQDDWKITRRLTLNLGLRYDFFGLPSERDGFQGTLDKAALVNGVNQITDLTVKKGGNWYSQAWNNFAPRLGFAYDLFGNGKTAIRGNYGMFNDRAIGAVINLADGNTPGFSQAIPVWPNLGGADIRFNEAYPLPQAPAAPVLTLAQTRSTSVVLFNPNLRTGYVQSYGLNIQHQIARSTILQVGYVGNRGVKLFMDRDVNQPLIYGDFLNAFKELQTFQASGAAVSPGNVFVRVFGSPQAAITALNANNVRNGLVGNAANTLDRNNFSKYGPAGISPTYLRNYPQFNQVILGTNDGRSYYDSLQVTLRRTVGSLQLTANYTWAKSMDNSSAEGNGFTTPIDNYNLRLNRALSDWDRPHSFNMSSFYTIPFGKGKRFGDSMPRLLDTIAGGWQMGGLLIWQSGNPFTVNSQRNTVAVSGLPAAGTFAQYNGTDTKIGSVDKRGNGVFYFTPDQVAMFTYPAAGQIGNAGRNRFRNPPYFDTDLSLVKRFAITEHHSLTFRTEAYNVFNHPQFGFLAANLNINNAATFGKFGQTIGTQVTGSGARILQCALRYDF